jgi:hypothetical protein
MLTQVRTRNTERLEKPTKDGSKKEKNQRQSGFHLDRRRLSLIGVPCLLTGAALMTDERQKNTQVRLSAAPSQVRDSRFLLTLGPSIASSR